MTSDSFHIGPWHTRGLPVISSKALGGKSQYFTSVDSVSHSKCCCIQISTSHSIITTRKFHFNSFSGTAEILLPRVSPHANHMAHPSPFFPHMEHIMQTLIRKRLLLPRVVNVQKWLVFVKLRDPRRLGVLQV